VRKGERGEVSPCLANNPFYTRRFALLRWQAALQYLHRPGCRPGVAFWTATTVTALEKQQYAVEKLPSRAGMPSAKIIGS